MNAFQSAVRAISAQYPTTNQDIQHDVDFHDTTDRRTTSVPSASEVLTYEKWNKTPRPRGRQAKDPEAEYVRFDCKDIDDLETDLSEYLQAPTAAAEHATIEFHFPITSAFMVYTRDFKRDSSSVWTSADVPDLMKKTAVSVMEVLQPTQSPKDQIVRQKAVARTIVEAIQRSDGFRYSFHNNWMSREDQAHRFSFFCNDSTLNKGRAANGGVGTEGRAKKKPVYDCKGLIAVKFSITKNNLEVHYRHVPVHKTYEERAPPPRRESKRRRMLEILDPEAAKLLSKKPKTASKVVEKGPSKRRGRPPKATTQPGSAPSVIQTGPVDESLQPLLDFLGSAERQTPLQGHETSGSQDDHNEHDGGFVIADEEHDCEPGDPNEAEDNAPSAEIANNGGSARTNKVSRPRAKYLDSVLPGTMQGSLNAGELTWSTTRIEATNTAPARQVEKTREAKNRTASDKTGEDHAQNLSGASKVIDNPLSEIELLKRQLAATQERLQKLEADKQTPQWSYPPYPYPYYPYPPVQYPPHPPPYGWTQPSLTASSSQSRDFQHYQTPTRTAQNSGPTLYPGGPPHPNMRKDQSQPTSEGSNPDRASGQDADNLAHQDRQAGTPSLPVIGTGLASAQIEDDAVNRTRRALPDPTVVPSASPYAVTPTPVQFDANATKVPAPVSASLADKDRQPAAAIPQARVSRPPPRRAEPITGVLKLVDNNFAQQAAHNVSFQVVQNAKRAGLQRGKLKLVGKPSATGNGRSSAADEDTRMKGLFDSALAAITGSSSVSGPEIIVYTPGPAGLSNSAPVSAIAMQPQQFPAPVGWLPPYGHTPYPYPYGLPPVSANVAHTPSESQPKQSVQAPKQSTYSFVQPPTPLPPPPKPAEQPPPGYGTLRAQMVAHAQPALTTIPQNPGSTEGTTENGVTAPDQSIASVNIRQNEKDGMVPGSAPNPSSGTDESSHIVQAARDAYLIPHSSTASSDTGSEVIITGANVDESQSDSSDDSE